MRKTVFALLILTLPGLAMAYRFQGGTVLRLSYNNYEVDGSGEAPDPTLNAARLEVVWGF